MISELKDDEILEFLMTSDLEGDYSPDELKYLLFKWRNFYRLLHARKERDKVEYEGEIQILNDKVNSNIKEKIDLQIKLADSENTINSMKSRNLTLKERWSGKIILKENGN